MATFTEFKDKALIGLFTFIVGMMWYDIKEMKQDIKLLIINNSENKTRLDALERQMYKTSSYKIPFPNDFPPKPAAYKSFAIINREEDYELDNEDV
jgi:hypothetical protein